MFRFYSEDENYAQDAERKLRHQMSSGFGTQQNDSRDEPTYAESIELRTICPTNSTETDPEDGPLLQRGDSDQDNHDAYLQYHKSVLGRSPSYKKSLDRLSLLSTRSSDEEEDERSLQETVKKISHSDIVFQMQQQSNQLETRYRDVVPQQSIRSNQRELLPRMASDQSLNTMSNDQDELMTRQSNLRDELLNCEQKELFQFLSDDFDTSNYFSDTVGYGSAMIDPDTDSLVLDNKLKGDPVILTPPRKTSSSSMRSNFSYISNSIFNALEQRRGGSISESIDRMLTRSVSNSKVAAADMDDREPLVSDSEFENIIASFEKELNEIKKSTPSLHRKLSISSEERSEKRASITSTKNVLSPFVHKRNGSNGGLRSPNHQLYEQLPTRRANTIGNTSCSNRESVKLKRRSLEKQSNIDDGFSVSNEIRKICDHMHAPFTEPNRQSGATVSPNLRRKSDFHSSFDRIKRSSLIERVDEAMDEELQVDRAPTKIVSEKLPRKCLSTDLQLDSISLKSTGSYENLLCHREQKHHQQQRIQFKDHEEETPKEVPLTAAQKKEEKKSKSPGKSPKKGMCCYFSGIVLLNSSAVFFF